MAWLMKVQTTHWLLDGKRVQSNTPGAERVTRESDKWYGCWKENGRTVRVPLAKDKRTAQARLTDLERQRERGKAGLIDPHKESKRQPVAEHLADYLADLKEQGCTADYIRSTENTLNRTFRFCKWRTLADFDADKLKGWIASQKNLSSRRKNILRQASVTFCNWLVRNRRLPDNPFRLIIIRKDASPKRKRRALLKDDLQHLLEITNVRPLREVQTVRKGKHKGEQTANVRAEVAERKRQEGYARYMLYRTAILTGLRRGELTALKVCHLNLASDDPTLHLPGEHTKNGKDAYLPLQHALAADLLNFIKGKGPQDKVFKVAQGKASVETLKRDLKAAGIPYQDETGRYFDFHSFRKCTTYLLNVNEVFERFRKIYMRHENTTLTDHYDDATLHNLRVVVEALPSFKLPDKDELQRREEELQRRALEQALEQERIEWLKTATL